MHRRHRLRARADFARVTRSGGRTTGAGFVLHHVEPGSEQVPRIGFAVGRQLGTAAVRNRTRRRLREAVRPLIAELPSCDVVIAARAGAAEAGVHELTRSLREALLAARLLRTGPGSDVGGTMGTRQPSPDVTEGPSS